MASELKVDKFTGVTTAGSVDVTGEGNSTTTNLQQGLAKFWAGSIVHSSEAVGDSFNMSSTTDGGTGRTDCNFTNNMSNSNCSVTYTATGQYPYQGFMNDTSSVRHTTINSSNSFVDASGHLTLHGDLA
jgi:hypothetical protein